MFNSRLDALSSKQYHVIQKADWVIYVMQLWTSILFKVLSACFTALTLLECPQGCWILGFGEQIIDRYLNGYIPTVENSKCLREVLNSPKYYCDMLTKNSNLIPKSAFEQSKERCKVLLER